MKKRIGLFFIVQRSLRQHALSTLITTLSIALGTGLVMAVIAIKAQSVSAFTGGLIGFDAVLGARGSPLQLVLNTVFHLETSPGNIPWAMYQAIKDDPRVELAIPYALGDNYHGFRIVGTTTALFTEFEYRKGVRFRTQGDGRFFDPNRQEAVLGNYAAEKLGLKASDRFHPYHGLVFDESMRHDEQYTVVGVLEPTNSPSDRVIWIPIEGIYRLEGHVLRGSGEEYVAQPGQEIPDLHKEVSAVMLKFRNPQIGFMMDAMINKQGKVATLAWPIGAVMAGLFDKIGWMNQILALVSYLVVLVAAGSILASIYNSINERRREFAILRSLGARRKNGVYSNCVGSRIDRSVGSHHRIYNLRCNFHLGVSNCSHSDGYRFRPAEISSCVRGCAGLRHILGCGRWHRACFQGVSDRCCNEFNTH